MINDTIKEILFAVTTKRSDNFKHINKVTSKNIHSVRTHQTTNFSNDKFYYCNYSIRLDNDETLDFQIRKCNQSIKVNRFYNHQIDKHLIDVEHMKLQKLYNHLT
ncbi:hypothetical protein [Vibrio splendidus]|uniref:hypothetical protein n=1 Tax=Vibrio splendidus TaxID=29497 RepID=UPI003D0B804F